MKQFNEYNENELKKVIGDDRVMLFFTATWCSDCRFIKPRMPEIEKENSNYKWIEVDRDANMDIARELRVMGIPSFVAFDNGEEIGRLVNKDRKTKEEVEAFIDTLPK
ncbi:thioredoxin family protein [Companilactobacillus sp. DQM5]|uniref:thioredoxin family protein n=1 Tax=Companilactobacillus sp. DQM5 TaxID=3463359 RepID=UPI004059F489